MVQTNDIKADNSLSSLSTLSKRRTVHHAKIRGYRTKIPNLTHYDGLKSPTPLTPDSRPRPSSTSRGDPLGRLVGWVFLASN